jgi:hypothetical protein
MFYFSGVFEVWKVISSLEAYLVDTLHIFHINISICAEKL